MAKTKVAIIGSGNIGTDLCIKALKSDVVTPVVMAGIDATSDGLRRAKEQGLEITADGIDGLFKSPQFDDIALVFDATSAAAHLRHAPRLAERGKIAVDLTPAAVGPYVVPAVNLAAALADVR